MKKRLAFIVFILLLTGCSDKLDFSECTKLEGEQQDSCLFIKTEEVINDEGYSDGRICELFNTERHTSKCYLNFGLKWRKTELCERAAGDDKNICMAVLGAEPEYCDKLVANSKKEECLSMVEKEQQIGFDYQNNPVFQEITKHFAEV